MRVPTNSDWCRWSEIRRRFLEREERERREHEEYLREFSERPQVWYDAMYRRWVEHEREQDMLERAEPLLVEEGPDGTFALLMRPDGKVVPACVIRSDGFRRPRGTVE